MPITGKALEFFQWVEKDPVHSNFSNKIILITLSVGCSCTQSVPGPRVKNRKEEWIECLLKKMPNSFTQEFKSNPEFYDDLISWIAQDQGYHNNIIPRPWLESPHGLHIVLEAFCFHRAEHHVCRLTPITLNQLEVAVDDVREWIAANLGNTYQNVSKELTWPPPGYNRNYDGLKRLKTVIANLNKSIQQQTAGKIPLNLLVILQKDIADLRDFVDEMLACCYNREMFDLQELYLFLSKFAGKGIVAKEKKCADYQILLGLGGSNVVARLIPFYQECKDNQNDSCIYP